MNKKKIKYLYNKGYNRIPIIYESQLNLENALTIYIKLNKLKIINTNNILLESITNKKNNRYSIITLKNFTKITYYNNNIKIIKNNKIIKIFKYNIFNYIKKIQNKNKIYISKKKFNFCGGLIGYFGYNSIFYIENKLKNNFKFKNIFNIPDIQLLIAEKIIIIDNILSKIFFIFYIDPKIPNILKKTYKYINKLKLNIKKKISFLNNIKKKKNKIHYYFKKNDYISTVIKAKKHIILGDIMQIQISQKIKIKYINSLIIIYKLLKILNPSQYIYIYNFGKIKIIGSSPETLIKKNKFKKITIKPIAGTIIRGKNYKQDNKLKIKLLSNKKELAEHLMLIDLARNDISKISIINSVNVIYKMFIEKYSHVQHIVSNIESILKNNILNIDILKYIFPAGTLSGTPKIKAIKIINKLENINRNIYGGGCGYLSFNNKMDLAIIIRTAIIFKKNIYIQSAAGIVFDSIPELEWKETQNKSKILLNIINKISKNKI